MWASRLAGLPFLALVLRHMLLHRSRALLTVVGVALGVAVAVAVQLANHSAMASFERSVRGVAGDARVEVFSGAGDLDERVVTRLRPLTDAALMEPVVEGVAVVANRPELAFRVLGVDLLSPRAFRGYARPSASKPGGLYMTAAAADRLKLASDDSIDLWVNDQVVHERVAGIPPRTSQTAALDSMVAFTDIAEAQELLGRVGRLDRVDLIPRPGEDIPRLQRLAAALLLPGEQADEPEASNRQAARMLAAFRVNMFALSYVALIVGAYLIYNAVSVSVVQRRREVATLRALGTSKARVFAIFAVEAALMGLAGALIGIALGSALARFAVRAVGQTVNALYVAAPVEGVTWTWTAFASGLGVGVGLALAAALVPALDAASTPPALAMRAGSWEARQGGRVLPYSLVGLLLLAASGIAARGPAVNGLPVWGYLAATLVILGCSLLAPAGVALVSLAMAPFARWGTIALLALRNFRRAVGRNAVAVAALMVGMAMTIGVATMVSSFRSTVSDWVVQTLPADFYIKPMGAEGTRRGLMLAPDLLGRVRGVAGVAAAEGFRNQYVAFDGVQIRLGASDADVLAGHGSLVVVGRDQPRDLFARLNGTDELLASETLAIKHGVKRGGTMVLPTQEGPHTFHVAGIFLDYSSDQGYVLMDRTTYRKYWHDDGVTDIAVYANQGADMQAVRGGLQKLMGSRPIRLQASRELRANVLDVFDATFAITYALHVVAMAVSLLGVVGTMFALVLERQRELSILRYVGLTRAQVRRLVVAESGLLGLTGVLLGLIAGGLLSALLIEVINRQSFGWSVQWHPPWAFIASASASLLCAALLAGLLPARAAANMPVAEGLRRE